MTRKIDITLVILVALVLLALAFAFWKGGWQLAGAGLVQAGHLVETVWLRLLLGLTLGGMIQVLIPRAVISRWLGPKSGIKGILIGSATAIIIAGPPYAILPVIASLYLAGAGVGPIMALLTGQSLIGLQTLLAWQIPFLGVGLPLSKYIVGLFITPLVALAGSAVFKLLTRLPDISANSESSISGRAQPNRGEKVSRTADYGEKR